MIERTKRTKLERLMIFPNLFPDCLANARKADCWLESWSEEQSERKLEKLMIFEIFSPIVWRVLAKLMEKKNIGESMEFNRRKCFASRNIFPQACDHPPRRPIPPFDYLPSRKIFCSSGARFIKPLQNQTLRNLTFIPCSAINLRESERLNNTRSQFSIITPESLGSMVFWSSTSYVIEFGRLVFRRLNFVGISPRSRIFIFYPLWFLFYFIFLFL